MSTFQALMALSATQTRESQSAVQIALRERQRKEELRRKQQEEQERKQREIERQLRLKHFEDEKREQERIERQEVAQRLKEAMLQRREEEQRDALRYGPKKAKAISSSSDGATPKWPTSSPQNRVREDVRKRRLPEDDADSAPEFLTREEKRERKQQLERRKLFHPTKRSSHSGSYSKAGKRLPGGAVDIATPSEPSEAASTTKSIRDRIAAMPNTLTKLNTVKRDTRTIDEILQDRAKARDIKVLDGDEARGFDDWFGTSKKRDVAKKISTQPATPTTNSGTNTPTAESNISGPARPSATCVPKKPVAGPTPVTKLSPLKTAPPKVPSLNSGGSKTASSASRSGVSDKHTTTKIASMSNGKAKLAAPSSSSTVASSRTNASAAKKRPRSTTRSESPPPKKRAASPELPTDLSSTIWKLFGRERNDYVGKDVMSDDEDMEADATVLEREEKFSSRIAKKEDILALEEEQRREDEKRRRKKEKDAYERRN